MALNRFPHSMRYHPICQREYDLHFGGRRDTMEYKAAKVLADRRSTMSDLILLKVHVRYKYFLGKGYSRHKATQKACQWRQSAAR